MLALQLRRAPWRQTSLSELVAGYLIAQRAANRSPATIAFNRVRLLRLCRDLQDAPPSRISAGTLRAWLLTVKEGSARTCSDRYVEQHRKAVRAFFSWCVSEGYLPSSPAARLASWTVEERELVILTEEQIIAIAAAARRGRPLEAERNRVMVALLYDTGLHCRELVEIELADVDLAAGAIIVRGKNRRRRALPLSRRMLSLLDVFIARRRSPALFPALASSRLFTDHRGRALLPTSVNQWLRRAARAAGVRGVRVSPHTFRHTMATHYIRNGGDESSLREILGHVSERMLRRYVHLARSDVRARHAIASPLERVRF